MQVTCHRMPESKQNGASTPLPKLEARQIRFIAGTIVDIVVFLLRTEMNDFPQFLRHSNPAIPLPPSSPTVGV